MSKFTDFGLLPSLLATLKEKALKAPTEIQMGAIPQLMKGASVVGIAETGSGKTFAYVLPILHMLKTLENEGSSVTEESSPRAVIVVPTRELGEQVAKVFKTFTHETRLRVRPALGGMAFDHARRNTKSPFDILLATPGRLVQMAEGGLLHLDDVRTIIFDEADQMLDEGFLPHTRKILKATANSVQLGLFSATVSVGVQGLIDSFFPGVEVVRSAGSGKTVKSLVTKNMMVIDGKRWPVLEKLLKEKTHGGTILFCNTREQADRLLKEIIDHGLDAVLYRGEMEIRERRRNMKRFRDGDVALMVATDVGSRGLDIEDVDRVINYHMPQQQNNYLHRVGRTARAGRGGTVYNFITERDSRVAERLGTKAPLPPPGTRGDREMREALRDKRSGPRGPSTRDRDAGAARPMARATSRPGSRPSASSARPASRPGARTSALPKRGSK